MGKMAMPENMRELAARVRREGYVDKDDREIIAQMLELGANELGANEIARLRALTRAASPQS